MSAFSNRVHLNTDNQNKIQSKTQSNPNHNIFSNNNKSKESPKPLNIQPNVDQHLLFLLRSLYPILKFKE
jgi:hypothetical protein